MLDSGIQLTVSLVDSVPDLLYNIDYCFAKTIIPCVQQTNSIEYKLKQLYCKISSGDNKKGVKLTIFPKKLKVELNRSKKYRDKLPMDEIAKQVYKAQRQACTTSIVISNTYAPLKLCIVVP